MANDFNPFIPEWWAMGALAVLNEALVAVPLFNQDYSAQFAKGGQIINTRRPSKMTATRKHKNTPITQQDVGAENVPIALDQHVFNSFEVYDLDQNWSMEELISEFLRPAGFALAKIADSVVLAQRVAFLKAGNVAGTSTQAVYDNIVDARTLMDNNLAPEDGRRLIIDPYTQGSMLKDRLLIQEYSAGSTQALRAGIVGNIVGVDSFKTQNLRSNAWNANTTGVMTLTNKAAILAGATSFQTAAQSSPAVTAGDWVLIAGVPYKVTNVAGSGDPYTFTLDRAVTTPLATTLSVYAFKGVTLTQDYPAGWGEPVSITPAANQYTPGVGDLIEINNVGYGIVAINTTNQLLLDRPLEVGVTAASHKVQTIPPGHYNFLAQRDSMTVVLRTLAPTRPGTGVLSGVASYNGLSVRAQMWYDPDYQKMKVSLDFLMGIKVLDTDMGAIVVS